MSVAGVELGEVGCPGTRSRWLGGVGSQDRAIPIALVQVHHEQLTHLGQMVTQLCQKRLA